MTELKQQALNKMLDEMNKPHDEVLDYIHNVLCESEDEELFAGILVEGKTIASAFNKMAELAKKAAKNSMAFFSPQKGMDIIIDYFKGKETEVNPIIGVKAGIAQSQVKEVPEMSREDKKLLIWAKSEKERQETEKAEKLAKKAEQEAKKTKQEPDVLMDIFAFGVELEPEPVKNHMSEEQAEVIAEIKAEAKANAWEDDIMPDDLDDEVTEDAADE